MEKDPGKAGVLAAGQGLLRNNKAPIDPRLMQEIIDRPGGSADKAYRQGMDAGSVLLTDGFLNPDTRKQISLLQLFRLMLWLKPR